MKEYTYIVPEESGKERLDKLLTMAALRPGLTRAQIQRLIAQGHVQVNQTIISDGAYKVRPEQIITVFEPPAEAAVPAAQAIALSVVFEDEHLIVINKPAGLVVHPGAGNPDQTLVNALLAHCGDQLSGIGGVRRPGIVHRLDKGTSGLMVVAKTDVAHQGLASQFETRTLSRRYIALVWGRLLPPEGEIDGPIGRHPRLRQKMAIVGTGKPALTFYKVQQYFSSFASLVLCQLQTGRTHQIRVHLSHRGHGLLGDPLYGNVPKGVPAEVRKLTAPLLEHERPALHAHTLHFHHPITQAPLVFEVPLPEDLRNLIDALKHITS
jgi:23S rRNA pseudouridine1911/1915/1917 synthase